MQIAQNLRARYASWLSLMLASTPLRHGKKDELPSIVSDSKMAQNCSKMMKLCIAQVYCEIVLEYRVIRQVWDRNWNENSKYKIPF